MHDLNRRSGLRRTRPNSFTLVEVVVAIAVIAFVLISILGLMTYTSQLVQQADTYSRLTHVTSQVLTRLNSQSYSASTNTATKGTSYYFTAEGLPTNAAGGYYECMVTNANPSPAVLANMMQIQVFIRWPKPQFTSTNVVITSTVKYD